MVRLRLKTWVSQTRRFNKSVIKMDSADCRGPKHLFGSIHHAIQNQRRIGNLPTFCTRILLKFGDGKGCDGSLQEFCWRCDRQRGCETLTESESRQHTPCLACSVPVETAAWCAFTPYQKGSRLGKEHNFIKSFY